MMRPAFAGSGPEQPELEIVHRSITADRMQISLPAVA
jgi:hypothetical protein